jgi:hypothetical protein
MDRLMPAWRLGSHGSLPSGCSTNQASASRMASATAEPSAPLATLSFAAMSWWARM